MTATFEWKICTGVDAATENAGSATNFNMMSVDAYDSTGTDYQTNRIEILESGTNYSVEKWIRGLFSGDFNLIENCKIWHSAGTLSDASLDLKAGVTDSGITPTDGASVIATNSLADWDTEAEALDVQNGIMNTTPIYSLYGVVQLEIPDTVTETGDIGVQTITFQYDES
jgi:hypothetical protein